MLVELLFDVGSIILGDDGMVIGIVKWFNEIKGYGFIVFEDGGKDVFVYICVLE